MMKDRESGVSQGWPMGADIHNSMPRTVVLKVFLSVFMLHLLILLYLLKHVDEFKIQPCIHLLHEADSIRVSALPAVGQSSF